MEWVALGARIRGGWRGLLSLGFAVVFVAGTSARAVDPPMLTVGHVGHDHQLALYVAADQGRSLETRFGVYLKPLKDQAVYDLVDAGMPVARVHLVRVGGGSKMPASLERGDIEVGLGGLGPVAKFVDGGAPLKVLAPLNTDGDALVVRPDFPAASWDEFVAVARTSERPVRVGYKAPMAVAYMILGRALEEEHVGHGPDPVDVDGAAVQVVTVNLKGAANILPSLSGGLVDAVVANEPMVAVLTERGVGRKVADLSALPPSGAWEGHPCCVVAAREDAVTNKAEAIRSLLRIIVAGTKVMEEDPEAAYAAEARWTKTPAQVGRRSIPAVRFTVQPDAEWLGAVDRWIELMEASHRFDGRFAGSPAAEVRAALLDLVPLLGVLQTTSPGEIR
ncbi:MAG: ABC transporter substrate-binding protein [Deferrisomatales bacterium]|nr:ABC transporter substrate-binding protein [Deferrisomatales bacterium]